MSGESLGSAETSDTTATGYSQIVVLELNHVSHNFGDVKSESIIPSNPPQLVLVGTSPHFPGIRFFIHPFAPTFAFLPLIAVVRMICTISSSFCCRRHQKRYLLDIGLDGKMESSETRPFRDRPIHWVEGAMLGGNSPMEEV